MGESEATAYPAQGTAVLEGMPRHDQQSRLYPQHLQVEAQDHLVVSNVWSHMEQLLSGPHEQLDAFIRQLTKMLPPLASIPAQVLPGIAHIHLQSASQIKTKMKLLAPEAFAGSVEEPVSMRGFADRLPPSAEPMVLALIELQIFHLRRAQEVAAQMRMNTRARLACMDMCATAAGDDQQPATATTL